jgi:hypothetical protein
MKLNQRLPAHYSEFPHRGVARAGLGFSDGSRVINSLSVHPSFDAISKKSGSGYKLNMQIGGALPFSSLVKRDSSITINQAAHKGWTQVFGYSREVGSKGFTFRQSQHPEEIGYLFGSESYIPSASFILRAHAVLHADYPSNGFQKVFVLRRNVYGLAVQTTIAPYQATKPSKVITPFVRESLIEWVSENRLGESRSTLSPVSRALAHAKRIRNYFMCRVAGVGAILVRLWPEKLRVAVTASQLNHIHIIANIQRCHNTHDAPMRARHAAATRQARKDAGRGLLIEGR